MFSRRIDELTRTSNPFTLPLGFIKDNGKNCKESNYSFLPVLDGKERINRPGHPSEVEVCGALEEEGDGASPNNQM